MVYRVLADGVVAIHLGFIVFVALGGFLAWRWSRVLAVHAPVVVYAAAIVTVGFVCPLTPLEKWLRRRAGDEGYSGGFVDRYVEGVVYPDRLTRWAQGAVALAVVVSYVGLWLRRARRRPAPLVAGRAG
jgi:hypothetical protein